MATTTRGLVVVLLLSLAAHASCATHNGRCGISSVSGSMQNCVPGGDDVIQIIPSYSLQMHNCFMSTQACVNITKEVKSATLQYSCQLGSGTKFSGTVDLCAAEKNLPKQVVEAMANLNIPNKCPMKVATICPNENSKVNMTGMKSALLMIPGSNTCTFNIAADCGRSCLKGNMVVKTLNRMIG